MKWISVKDELPFNNSLVLATVYYTGWDCKRVVMARFNSGKNIWEYAYNVGMEYGFSEFGFRAIVTHWMPYPEPANN